jgi:hypothetical protein
MSNIFVLGGCAVFMVVWALLMLQGKRFMMWPQKKRLASMGALGLVMFLVVYVGWKEADKRQATLMTVCWEHAHAVYQGDLVTPTCPAPVELIWAKKTKLVFWGLGSDRALHRGSLTRAIKYWNKGLDHTVLEETKDRDKADIVIIEQSGASGKTATSHVNLGDGDLHSRIKIRDGMINTRRFMLELEHELGHALGLAHDAGASIMNRTLPEVGGQKIWLITEKDRKRLRKVMGL